MPAQTTRTLNPLPFQDLEPHRFEDLVRQLAYGWRTWVSLEALGRAGQDDGMDIRGIEAVADERRALVEDEGQTDEDLDEPAIVDRPVAERLWVIQCKREKSMGSSALKKTIEASLRSLSSPPHGFVLAVAADVSKKAREVFRAEMVGRGVKEFHLWARGELEDMLFQAQNDSLLFAYFNLSLQPRRRGLTTQVRSNLSVKRHLRRLVEANNRGHQFFLVRDATDANYPGERGECAGSNRHWVVCEIEDLKYPGDLMVLTHKRLAAVADDEEGWDALLDTDMLAGEADSHLMGLHAWGRATPDGHTDDTAELEFWREHIEERSRAHFHEFRWIPFNRIVAVDPDGDGYFPVPHIWVMPDPVSGLFDDRCGASVHPVRDHVRARRADRKSRAAIFPQPLPAPGEPLTPPFDMSLTGKSLPKDLRQQVQAKLAKPVPLPTGAAEAPDRAKAVVVKMATFDTWRKEVGLPTFSAWAGELKDLKQRAVVVASSDIYNAMSKEPSLTLRIWIEREGAPGHVYWAKGEVFVRFSAYRGWAFTAEPGQAGSYKREEIKVPEGGPSADLLNQTVLSVMDRLASAL